MIRRIQARNYCCLRYVDVSLDRFHVLVGPNATRMRQPSPPTRRREVFAPDGSNLPRVIRQLREENENVFEDWLAHVRAALPEIDDIRVVEREDDRHCYLVLRYGTGVEVPSWQVSDGTLRLLALTLPAYLKDPDKVYLMEEPENGLHPGVVQDVYDALSSVHDSQVLLATHSPIFLSHANLNHLLCLMVGRVARKPLSSRPSWSPGSGARPGTWRVRWDGAATSTSFGRGSRIRVFGPRDTQGRPIRRRQRGRPSAATERCCRRPCSRSWRLASGLTVAMTPPSTIF